MMNKILILIVIGILGIGSWYLLLDRPEEVEPLDIVVSEPTDFVEVGTLIFPPVDQGQSTGSFVYKEVRSILMNGASVNQLCVWQ